MGVPHNAKISHVVVRNLDLIRDMTAILSGFKDEYLQYYFLWKLIHANHQTLPSKVIAPAYFYFGLAINGVPMAPPREAECIHMVEENFAFVLGKYFVENLFHDSIREKSQNMISSLKDVLKTRLMEARWMDRRTRIEALDKLEKMRSTKIGYPDWILNATTVAAEYGFELVPENFFETELNINRHMVKAMFEAFGQEPERDSWSMPPQETNAYYSPLENEIVFPAAIIQHPFFSSNAPTFLNYGALGTVIGHEITHGFDNNGLNLTFAFWNTS